MQKCQWGFSSTFAPSLRHMAPEEPLASRKGVWSQVTQQCEQKINQGNSF